MDVRIPTDPIAAACAALPPLITIDEAAALLRCRRQAIHGYIASGRLRASKVVPVGRSRTLIARGEIERVLRCGVIAAGGGRP